jgi:hypothetical protein
VLKRCNRPRGFSTKFARHRKVHDNYRIFQGLNYKSFTAAPMVAGGYCWPISQCSRAHEITRSGANERGQRGDSIPYLTYRGDASWWPNFAGEDGGGGSVLGGSPSVPGSGAGQGRCRRKQLGGRVRRS